MRNKPTKSALYGTINVLSMTPWELRVLQEAIALASIPKTAEQITLSGTLAHNDGVGKVMRDFCVLI